MSSCNTWDRFKHRFFCCREPKLQIRRRMGHAEKPARFEWARTKKGHCSEAADEVRERHSDGWKKGNGAHGHTHTGELLLARHVEGVAMKGPYVELLQEVTKEINCWNTKKGATSRILGCDAQVEFQPNQEPFTGCGIRRQNEAHSS